MKPYRWLAVLAVLLIAAGGCAATPKRVMSRAECPGWSKYPMVNMLRSMDGDVCGHCDRCRGGAGPLAETMRELQEGLAGPAR